MNQSDMLAIMSSQPSTAAILFVDDQAARRAQFKTVLEDENHIVLEAQDAIAALDLLQRKSNEIDMMVVARVTPHSSGLELVLTARQMAPAMPFILIADAAFPVGVQTGFAVLLDPVSPKELVETVRQLQSQ
jgi:CheY-like chemotaxis protein